MLKKILKVIPLIIFAIVIGCYGSGEEAIYKKVVEKRKIDGNTIELEQTAYHAGSGDWLVVTDVEMDGKLRIYYRPEVEKMVYDADCEDIKEELKRQLEIMRPKFEEFYDKVESIVNDKETAEQCIEELESETRTR